MAHRVTVNVDQTKLPNGNTYGVGASVILTDDQFANLWGTAFSDGTLTDSGYVGVGAVSSQAPTVTPAAALTSSQNATANAVNPANAAYTLADQTAVAALANSLKVSYNALQVDVAALQTKVNALITALRTAGGPMI